MNIGNPSPQEIFDSYSQIPNTAQGKQMLSQLAQAFKNSGDMRGSIATSILNSYNSQQATPPPPQGQVVDQVVAQAEPPSWQQGIAAPGMAAPQGMAAGGLVAFADGGGISNPWGLDSFGLQAPDTSMYEADLAQQNSATPPAVIDASDTSSIDSKIKRLGDLIEAPPDIAAEILSRMEYEQAQRKKFNVFENIAAGLGGYLSAYGTGAHRAGAGIASMLAAMGQHEREDSEDRSTMDALRIKAAMQPYEFRKGLAEQVIASETAHNKAKQDAAVKLALAKYARETNLMKGKQAGEYGLRGHELSAEAARYAADKRAEKTAGAGAWDKSKLTGPAKASILSALINQGMEIDEIKTSYPELAGMIDAEAGLVQQSSTQSAKPIQFKLGTGWLR